MGCCHGLGTLKVLPAWGVCHGLGTLKVLPAWGVATVSGL